MPPDPSPPPSAPLPPGPPLADRLFRKAALDRLSTTEDLDQPATLAAARGRWWRLGLAALCLGVSVAMIVVIVKGSMT